MAIRWRLGALALGLLAVALLVAGVARVGPFGSAVERLDQRPESALTYPGSVLLRRGGHEATSGSAAANWQQFGSSASLADIVAFYTEEFAARGFAEGGGSSGIPTQDEQIVCAWHGNDIVVRISAWKPEEFRRWYPTDPTYPTVYELRLIDKSIEDDPPACNRSIG